MEEQKSATVDYLKANTKIIGASFSLPSRAQRVTPAPGSETQLPVVPTSNSATHLPARPPSSPPPPLPSGSPPTPSSPAPATASSASASVQLTSTPPTPTQPHEVNQLEGQVEVDSGDEKQAEPIENLPKTLEDAVDFFIRVIEFFSAEFTARVDASITQFTALNPGVPEEKVRDALGVWMCLHRLSRPHFTQFSEPISTYLTLTTALPPVINWEGTELLAEKSTYIFTRALGEGLINIANVKLCRTRDMASHLYFDRSTRVLYLFMTPGISYSANQPDSPHTCIPAKFSRELARTYKLLFEITPGGRKVFCDFLKTIPNLKQLIPSMRERRRKIGELWTRESTSNGLDVRIRGPDMPLGDYELRDFPYFGERLLVLERFLAEARPGTLRQLLKDSRDQLQYYTFIVAIVVFGLTVLGLILAILQTVASFWQVRLALDSASGPN